MQKEIYVRIIIKGRGNIDGQNCIGSLHYHPGNRPIEPLIRLLKSR